MPIRPIIEADVAAYRALRLRALAEEPESFGASPEEFAAQSLAAIAQQRLAPSADAFILGAWMPDLVGMVGFFRHAGPKARHKGMIWGIYVAPEGRGRGLGRALMTGALALYLALGFTIYGIEHHALKLGDRYVDEELMALDVAGAPLP